MRFEICAAAALLVGNFAAVDRTDRTDRTETPAPVTIRPTARPIVVPDKVEHNPDEAAKLAALWMSHNAGSRRPPCAYHDPLAVLDADVDPTPGREHLIGNRRHGVAMYSEQGELIARMDPIGCDVVSDITQDQSISLGYRSHLMVTARTARDGVHWTTGHLVELREDKLVSVAKLMLDTTSDQLDVSGAISRQGDQLLVKYHGRSRAPGSTEWQGVDIHCTLSRIEGTFVADDPASPCAEVVPSPDSCWK
jgi:hypothetical protein